MKYLKEAEFVQLIRHLSKSPIRPEINLIPQHIWQLLVLLVFASSLEVASLFPLFLVLSEEAETIFSLTALTLYIERRVVMEIWDQIEFPSSSSLWPAHSLTHTQTLTKCSAL